MKLKSFGCSFIFGSELSDDGRNGPYATPSRLTWPALLSKDLGYDYECHARPGCGNLFIAERVLNQVVVDDPAIFVINWSFIDRFDYVDPTAQTYEAADVRKWLTCRPSTPGREPASDLYYRNFHHEYRDKLMTLILVKNCIDTLKQKNIKFLMTYMDDLMFDTRWHTSPAVTAMQEYTKSYCTEFNGMNFVRYGRDFGHHITEAGHILESGHREAFEYIKRHNLL